MIRLIARRLALSVPLLFVVSFASFLLVALIPGDAARTILGTQATQQQYESLRQSLGLDQPIWVRYTDWLKGALHGDLGTSLFNQQPVTALLNVRIGPTLSLVVCTTILASVLGISLGLVGALRGGVADTSVSTVTALGIAIPDFFLGLILATIFAVRLGWFPATGYVAPSVSLSQWAASLVLPVVTLSAPALAVIARQTRAALGQVFAQPFMRTLRSTGLPWRSLILKHALRNAGIPIATVVGLVFVGVLSGTVLAETVFALPGVGTAAVQAVAAHDLPVIQGCVLYFTVLVIVINLLVDIAYGLLDPRVRAS